MRYVDKLIIKAKKQVSFKSERVIQAFITFDEIKKVYTTDCRLWNGINGTGTRQILSEHKTEGEAIQAAHEVANEYPNKFNNIVIFFGDYLFFSDEDETEKVSLLSEEELDERISNLKRELGIQDAGGCYEQN